MSAAPEKMVAETIAGGCYCGGVSFTATGPFGKVSACHCSQCLRISGGPFHSTDCQEPNLSFEKRETLSWFNSSPGHQRGFCSKCGSPLFWRQEGDPRISISLTALDENNSFSIARHIFVADKPTYYTIGDDAPRFAAGG